MLNEAKLFSLGRVVLKGKKDFQRTEVLEAGKREWEKAQKLGIELVFREDPQYPSLLKHLKDPPACLYVKGKLQNQIPLLAIVGTRKPTPYGRKVAREWARELASHGLGIVSGLAIGIDTEAHRGALEAGGYTIAVLGSGLDWIYPYENRRLAEEIVEKGGALISEFPLGSRPERWHFPQRNRILSGLCLGVLVVEAARKSGSLITARLAAEAGREVMTVPGSVFSPQSQGTHYLLQQGAHPVISPKDILDILNITYDNTDENIKFTEISALETKLLERLSMEPKHFDQLLEETQWSVSELSEILLALEIKGLIQSLPGKFYQRLG